jgi:hypothetical protein
VCELEQFPRRGRRFEHFGPAQVASRLQCVADEAVLLDRENVQADVALVVRRPDDSWACAHERSMPAASADGNAGKVPEPVRYNRARA